jgi:hypothetical protein
MPEDIGPDGILDIIGEPDEATIAFVPSMTDIGNHRPDERDITIRRSTQVITPNQTITVLDNKESGQLNYVLLKATTSLPGGGTGADPGKLALFLQLDGHVMGGFESIYNSALGGSVAGIRLETLSDLNLPSDMKGNWALTVDSTSTKVALFRGEDRGYKDRIRLMMTNTHQSTDLAVEFVEIARKRRTVLWRTT